MIHDPDPVVVVDQEDAGAREDVAGLCDQLAGKVRDNGFTVREPQAKSWQDPIRLLLDRDQDPKTGEHWTVEQVAHVIDWATGDEFWRRNVRSPDSLRKNFERFVLEVRSPRVKKGSLEEANADQAERVAQHHRLAAIQAANPELYGDET